MIGIHFEVVTNIRLAFRTRDLADFASVDGDANGVFRRKNGVDFFQGNVVTNEPDAWLFW